jgi:UDP-N-acetyl-D-mannosaminuronic acid dehydrogenase
MLLIFISLGIHDTLYMINYVKNRSTDEIITSILQAAYGGAAKTTIMYKAFITYDQLNEFLSLLVEKELIDYREGERSFKTTAQGLSFLQSNVKSTQFNKVLIVGLGQLGLPVAKYVKDRGFDDVYGYDISHEAMERAEKTAGIKKANDFSDFDVYVLCVSTHKSDDIFSPQIEGLLSIVERISKEAKRNGALLSIESTIPKGTSKKVFEILNHRLHVAHAPHRWYSLEEKEHGVNQLRIVGGVSNCCLEAAMQFYHGKSSFENNIDNNDDDENTTSNNNNNINNHDSIDSTIITTTTTTGLPSKIRKSLGIPMHPVSEIEMAELAKIVENAHRYLQIAFAEDLYLYCQANNINFPELRDALNTKWNVHILEPREGIGGHCLPKDTKMFLQSSQSIKSKILTAAIEVDEDYRQYIQSRPSKSLLSSSSSSTSKLTKRRGSSSRRRRIEYAS